MDILRQIVASPRVRHAEAGLDLCYVTDSIIATSGPSATYPQIAYRNPLRQLVKFLDEQHGTDWAIWEFRAEGTGYPDEEVYNRIWHYPWPDHHPPPFRLVPLIMASMRNWLKSDDAAAQKNSAGNGRVAVVHCKAGKGRSGTVCCSFLISEEGWKLEDALERFTKRRMRPGFGAGVSIPSQKRWVGYVDRWTKHGKAYVERPVEIVELHVWGLRSGVKVAAQGFVDEGKKIHTFHTFRDGERTVFRGKPHRTATTTSTNGHLDDSGKADSESAGDVVFRPSKPITVPTSDINIDFVRRNNAKYGGLAIVTSVAHVWFNTFFEGNGPEQDGAADSSGVFNIDFNAMDGIKGSLRKGTRAFDRLAVVWKTAGDATQDPNNAPSSTRIDIPKPGEEVPQPKPADWKKTSEDGVKSKKTEEKQNGEVSTDTEHGSVEEESDDELAGVQSDITSRSAAPEHE